jgi:hypothetical protein
LGKGLAHDAPLGLNSRTLSAMGTMGRGNQKCRRRSRTSDAVFPHQVE